MSTTVTPARCPAIESQKLQQPLDLHKKSSVFADALSNRPPRGLATASRSRPDGRDELGGHRPGSEGLARVASEIPATPVGAHDFEAPPAVGGRREQGSDGSEHPFAESESHALGFSSPAPDVFDPMARVLATPGMRPALTAESPVGATVTLPPDFDRLLTRMVRRVAFGGDGRRGSARIEIGEGELAGATIVVHTEEREVRVEVDLPPGVAAEGWRQRIERRLENRGLSIRELVVR